MQHHKTHAITTSGNESMTCIPYIIICRLIFNISHALRVSPHHFTKKICVKPVNDVSLSKREPIAMRWEYKCYRQQIECGGVESLCRDRRYIHASPFQLLSPHYIPNTVIWLSILLLFIHIAPVMALSSDAIHILLVGLDAPSSRYKLQRADAIVLIRIESDTHVVRALSIPRDSKVIVPQYHPMKINATYVLGGIKLLKRVVQ